MEETIKKVEEVLNSLSCGLVFEKKIGPNGCAWFNCYSEEVKIQAYGLTMEVGITIYVSESSLGTPVVDRHGNEWVNREELSPVEVIALIKEKTGMSEDKLYRAYDAIVDLWDLEQVRMFELVVEEFETRLPDVEIVDREYGIAQSV